MLCDNQLRDSLMTKFQQNRIYLYQRKPAGSALISVLFLFFVSSFANAQELPDKIRGYKVHKAKISVKTIDQKGAGRLESSDNEAFVKINEPEVLDVSLTGITFALEAELSTFEQSGTVDFLTFHDFRVNGLKVDVAEYDSSFKFQKNEPIFLPKPVTIFLGTAQALTGVVKEMKESKKEWRVTGRVFVFGKFKKSIFKFKRVVPVEIDILIKNPLNELQAK